MNTLTLALLMGLATSSARAATVDFDELPTGSAPPGWTATKTGPGSPKWEVVADASAPSQPNVLRQSGVAAYPICLKDDTSLKDGFVEVKFKPVSGNEDRAGGVIWRCQDANNYYVARANAAEDNVTIYQTVQGRRTEKKRLQARVASGQWHTFRVDFKDHYFIVTFDGRRALGWKDATFQNAGKVGLWTKADSTTLFDDFSYGARSNITPADMAALDQGGPAPGPARPTGPDADNK